MYFPFDNDTGWICGRLGTIQKTENGGTNWLLMSSGTSQHLNSIYVDRFVIPAADYGYCVGNGGTILHTSSGGLAWDPQESGTTNNLNDISHLDIYNEIAVGSAGTILKTINDSSWIAQTSGTTEDLKSVYFINPTTGYVCGTHGTIKITIDAGTTWTAQSSGTTSTLNSIDFEETMEENGYAVGENGTVIETTNGGTSWIKKSSGGCTALNSVFAREVPSSSGSFVTVIRLVGGLTKYAVKKPATVLPVELSSFTFSLSGNHVTLNWTTLREINNKGFEVERKVRGGSAWSKLGFIKGAGNMNEVKNYTFTDNSVSSGSYNYRLKQIDYNGNFEYHELNREVMVGLPERFELMQNYPNPFNPSTTIIYLIPIKGFVSLKIYDLRGREIGNLVNEVEEAGYYSSKVEISKLGSISSGVYFYTLNYDGKQITKKMVLVK